MAEVHTTLNYNSHETPREYHSGTALAYTIPRVRVPVRLRDARTQSTPFSLDKQGFELHEHTTHASLAGDKFKVQETYYPEIVSLLKRKSANPPLIPPESTCLRTLLCC
jgi:hypothetical protein